MFDCRHATLSTRRAQNHCPLFGRFIIGDAIKIVVVLTIVNCRMLERWNNWHSQLAEHRNWLCRGVVIIIITTRTTRHSVEINFNFALLASGRRPSVCAHVCILWLLLAPRKAPSIFHTRTRKCFPGKNNTENLVAAHLKFISIKVPSRSRGKSDDKK